MGHRKDDRHYMASVKLGPKGQIVIPKEVRAMFGLEPGDTLAGFMAHYADLGSTLEEIIVAAERRPYDADAII